MPRAYRSMLPLLALLPAIPLLESAPSAPPVSGPVPGPGGVLHAVERFLTARDHADATACAELLDTERELLVFRAEGEGYGHEQRPASRFFAVDLHGKPMAVSNTPAAFVPHAIASMQLDGCRVKTELLEVCAACTSEEVSRAVLRFDRLVYRGEELVAKQPLQATATLRWNRGEGPDFLIYHWHESLAAAAPEPDKRP